jgi:hypothetical protein
MKNDIPFAFGMEFGTTGMHEPFPVLAGKGKIFGRNLYDFIDAGEIKTKSYMAFLSKIPEDYTGVDKIYFSGESMLIREMKNDSRDIVHPVKYMNL